MQQRLPKLLGKSPSRLVPPLRRRSRLKITVPSLSSTFLLVLAGYEVVESSTMLYRSSILPSSAFRPLGTNPVRDFFRIREARKSPRRELFTSSAGIKCQKLFGQDRSWKRKESCCGRFFASDLISAKNAWPRARHRSRQFRRPAESARLLPDRQKPASWHISRSDHVYRNLPAPRGCL